MEDQTTNESTPVEVKKSKKQTKTIAIVGATIVVLGIGTVVAYQYSKNQASTTVLPGGVTYLGPTATVQPTSNPLGVNISTKFTTPDTTPWQINGGKHYPYTFSYPNTLFLITFTNDPTDSYAIKWNGVSPQQNILIRVNDLNTTEKTMSAYINKPKKEYVQNWWKQYSGLKGVASEIEFVTTRGMKGYRMRYLNTAGQTPTEDIFYEVPNHPELMVRIANGVLDQPIFDKIVDSFFWDANKPIITE